MNERVARSLLCVEHQLGHHRGLCGESDGFGVGEDHRRGIGGRVVGMGICGEKREMI